MSSTATFHRTVLAKQMADQMLHPGPLDGPIQSGLFLFGKRRIGKTTFLKFDLVPELEKRRVLVVYVDLWSQPTANPSDLVNDAVRDLLAEWEKPVSPILGKIKVERLGKPGGMTLAQVFTELIDQAKTDVVLIIDEVQHALGTPAGKNLLFSLKAARDAVNTRAGIPKRLLVIGAGSHQAQIQEMVIQGNQAFHGAYAIPYPVLGNDYVDDLLARTASHLNYKIPSADAAYKTFELLGQRPEEMFKALSILIRSVSSAPIDEQLSVIAQTLRANAATVELLRLENLGDLATEIFDRVCSTEQGTRGLFGTTAMQHYAGTLGRPVSTSDVQSALGHLADANLVMRREPGRYEVTDPLVRDAWLSRQEITGECFDVLSSGV